LHVGVQAERRHLPAHSRHRGGLAVGAFLPRRSLVPRRRAFRRAPAARHRPGARVRRARPPWATVASRVVLAAWGLPVDPDTGGALPGDGAGGLPRTPPEAPRPPVP